MRKIRLQLTRGPIVWGRAVELDAFLGWDWSIDNGGGSPEGGDFLFEVFYFFVLLGLPIYKGTKVINLIDQFLELFVGYFAVVVAGSRHCEGIACNIA